MNALSTQIEKEESLVKMLNIEIKLKERKIKNINKTILESKGLFPPKKQSLKHLGKIIPKLFFRTVKIKG